MEQPNLGKRISEIRKAKGLTQQELAEQCKVSTRTLQRIENGVVMPRTYTVRTIFATLGSDFQEKDNLFVRLHFERLFNNFKDLFNLKINTMKKVSILVAAVLAIGFGLFALSSESKAQKDVGDTVILNKGTPFEKATITLPNGNSVAGQMTMSLKPDGVVSIRLCGFGSATIDWGDGTKNEIQPLMAYNDKNTKWLRNNRDEKDEDEHEYTYNHEFSSSSPVTITITGENITFLGCNFLKLTSLDISRNTALIYLHCSNNQLTSLDMSNNIALTHLLCDQNLIKNLDVSKNTVLTYLNCGGNQLTSLDVSKNAVLSTLWCAMNDITSLDLSRNTTLTSLYCFNNKLSTAALKFLFETLHENGKYRRVYVGNNPGNAYNQSIATSKGWTVNNSFF
jgi:transcriptional regulator with XRE-family HTH domain